MTSLGDDTGVPPHPRAQRTHSDLARLNLYRALLKCRQDPNFSQLFVGTRHQVTEALDSQGVLEDDPAFSRLIPNEDVDDVPPHIRLEDEDSDRDRWEEE